MTSGPTIPGPGAQTNLRQTKIMTDLKDLNPTNFTPKAPHAIGEIVDILVDQGQELQDSVGAQAATLSTIGSSLGTLETTVGGLVTNVGALQATVNTPETGLVDRVEALESAASTG